MQNKWLALLGCFFVPVFKMSFIVSDVAKYEKSCNTDLYNIT